MAKVRKAAGTYLSSCLVLLLIASASSAVAADPTSPTRAVQVIAPTVHDGDTLSGQLLLGWNVWLGTVSIRAYGYDAYEINKVRQTVEVTDEEIVKGKAAKYAMVELLERGSLYAEDSGHRDPYGRISAILWVKTNDGQWIYLAKFMEDGGFLRVPRTK